ncbi:uncharacterized protein N7515_000781 [Penicillium bovifimosum]|uniref:Methyltransferase domain-containing protein n=1 Tax=Penicillium bovifimosum TaxID=126998 RepID=A0A9W9LBD6_9EURO|nr:uncharacterized protein N7515_000781 [Penicillium bovifimosum]KAJ5146217.1 hypothetical protein N7515_000781 [Penicillium bovifimosum]
MVDSTENTKTLFSSPYLVDYYDLLHPISDSDDATFYWRVYQELRSPLVSAPRDPFIIMDLGTGNGRVIRAIASYATLTGDDMYNCRILGVDNAPHMLERARQNDNPFFKEHVFWYLGSALNLEKVMSQSGFGKVDLLIFSLGSIGYLTQEGQLRMFLRQLSRVLRPNTGRAFVSIYDCFALQKMEAALLQPEDVTKTKSTAFANIVYRGSNLRSEVTDKVREAKFDLQVLEVTEKGEKLLETNKVSMKLRQWDKDELVCMATGTGVRFVESFTGKQETICVFQTEA